jgi:hypothetical protein
VSRAVRRKQPFIPDNALSAAGWLFAEFALVLAIMAFGSERPGRVGVPNTTLATATDISAAPPGVSTSTAPPPLTAVPEGISLESHKMVIHVPVDGRDVVGDFRQQLDSHIGANARVGLILLFGVSRTGNPLDGTGVSQSLKEQIQYAGIRQLRSLRDTDYIRTYLGDRSDGEPGDVLVELFLLNGPG